MPVAGMPYTMASDLFGDFVPGSRRLRRAATAGCRLRDRRQDQHVGVRDPAGVGAAALRSGAQSVGHRPDAGWLERRRGRGRGGGHAAAGPRGGWRWLDSDPGVVLRARRAEAHARADLPRSRPGRRLPRPGRRADQNGGGHRGPARPAERLRGRRRQPGRRRPQSHSPRRPRASPGGCASATPRPRPSRRRSTRFASRPFWTRRSCSPNSATTSRRSRRRGARSRTS